MTNLEPDITEKKIWKNSLPIIVVWRKWSLKRHLCYRMRLFKRKWYFNKNIVTKVWIWTSKKFWTAFLGHYFFIILKLSFAKTKKLRKLKVFVDVLLRHFVIRHLLSFLWLFPLLFTGKLKGSPKVNLF